MSFAESFEIVDQIELGGCQQSFEDCWNGLPIEYERPEELFSLLSGLDVMTFNCIGESEIKGLNLHALEAHIVERDIVEKALKEGRSGFGYHGGCMSASKSTIAALFALHFNAQVFKHKLDRVRYGPDKDGNIHVWTQSEPEGLNTDIKAQEYETIDDVIKGIDVEGSKVIIIDEFQFAGLRCDEAGKVIRKGKINQRQVDKLHQFANENGLIIIFSCLDLTYDNQVWSNVELIVPQADLFRVHLTAECSMSGCKAVAMQTMRLEPVDDGWGNKGYRPASTDEDKVVIGTVHKSDDEKEKPGSVYQPTCTGHHRSGTGEYKRDFGMTPLGKAVRISKKGRVMRINNKGREYCSEELAEYRLPQYISTSGGHILELPDFLRRKNFQDVRRRGPIPEKEGEAGSLVIEVSGPSYRCGKTTLVEILAEGFSQLFIGNDEIEVVVQPEQLELNPYVEDTYEPGCFSENFRLSQETFNQLTRAQADEVIKGIHAKHYPKDPKDGDGRAKMKLFLKDAGRPMNLNYARARAASGKMRRVDYYRYWEDDKRMKWHTVPRPDLRVVITASDDVLLERVRKSIRHFETAERDYILDLKALNEAELSSMIHWDEDRVLVVDTDNFDFSNDVEEKGKLFRMVVKKLIAMGHPDFQGEEISRRLENVRF